MNTTESQEQADLAMGFGLPQQRAQTDGPWCWQNKTARRLIRKRFSELNCISSALSVYDALCELASDAQSDSFEMATPTIAETAGVGTRTAQGILPKLVVFGFIEIATRKFPGTNMDAPSVYTLRKVVGDSSTNGNGCAPVGNGCAPVRSGRKQSSLRTSEESLKESLKEFPEQSTPQPPSPAAPAAGARGGKAATEQRVANSRKQRIKDASEPDPRSALVNSGYCEAFEEAFGSPYVHSGGRDGARLKHLLSTASAEKFPAETIIATAKAAMKRSKEPYAKATKGVSTLSGFCDGFNAIRAELATDSPHSIPVQDHRNDALGRPIRVPGGWTLEPTQPKRPASQDASTPNSTRSSSYSRNDGTLNAGTAAQYGGGVIEDSR